MRRYRNGKVWWHMQRGTQFVRNSIQTTTQLYCVLDTIWTGAIAFYQNIENWTIAAHELFQLKRKGVFSCRLVVSVALKSIQSIPDILIVVISTAIQLDMTKLGRRRSNARRMGKDRTNGADTYAYLSVLLSVAQSAFVCSYLTIHIYSFRI